MEAEDWRAQRALLKALRPVEVHRGERLEERFDHCRRVRRPFCHLAPLLTICSEHFNSP
jgi:hypothetical protein